MYYEIYVWIYHWYGVKHLENNFIDGNRDTNEAWNFNELKIPRKRKKINKERNCNFDSLFYRDFLQKKIIKNKKKKKKQE